MALVYFSPRLVNKYRCSLKLREYFAAGIKVVCNDFAELKDYEHLTYQSDTTLNSFAAMIVSVLRSGGDGRERTAKEYAQQHPHWPLIVESMLAEIKRRIQAFPVTNRSSHPTCSAQLCSAWVHFLSIFDGSGLSTGHFHLPR